MAYLSEFVAQQHGRLLTALCPRFEDEALLESLLHDLTRTLRGEPSAQLEGATPDLYGALRDALFAALAQADVTPQLAELHVLTTWLMAGSARNSERPSVSAADRHHLLELLQQAPGFVCFLRGPQLVFELANPAYFQLVGHRDILGKPLREALPELDGQGYFELLEGIWRSKEAFVGRALKVSLQRSPGATLTQAFVDLVYQPIVAANGEMLGILTQGHDVTELKFVEAQRLAAESALRASEQRYRTLFESIDDGFCLMQLMFDERGRAYDYRFLETNVAFEGQTGLRNAVGKTARELVPTLDDSWFQLYGRVATTGETARFENHAPAMGRWFDVYANRVGEPEQRLVALVFKDISDRKRIEQERELLLALESAARQRAEEASRLKDDFLATVSHELRTPLSAMLGWVQLLRAGTLAPDRRERALETVERNARAQAQLVEDLLDVSSILAGKLRLNVEPVELRGVVEAAVETVRPAAEAKDIRLQATLDGESVVMGDSHRLHQIAWNLLSNAVKFTPKGGRVQVLVLRDASSVQLSVADNGQGISRTFQPHVFERFRQADGAASRLHGGLGLGLSIVRQLVELHGGTVAVASEGEGRGATFTVRVPVAPLRRSTEHELSRESLLERLPPELAGLHVLVVDDEEDSRELLRALLESGGAEVRCAASVAEAMALLSERLPDVLVSDVGMPGEDGYTFVRKLRALPVERGGALPAVALTAFARVEDRLHALQSGFHNHVTKPVDPAELLAVIASLVARSRR